MPESSRAVTELVATLSRAVRLTALVKTSHASRTVLEGTTHAGTDTLLRPDEACSRLVIGAGQLARVEVSIAAGDTSIASDIRAARTQSPVAACQLASDSERRHLEQYSATKEASRKCN